MGIEAASASKFMSGAFSSFTEKGDPDKMIPFSAGSKVISLLNGSISQNTLASRTTLAINWVYCEPKSRIMIFSVISGKGNLIAENGGGMKRMWDAGYGIQETGCGMQDAGYGIRDTGYRMQDTGYRMLDSGWSIVNKFIVTGESFHYKRFAVAE